MVSESHQVNHRHAPSEHPRNRCFTPAFTPMLGPSGGARFVDVELDIGMMRSVRRAKRDTPDLTALRRPTWSRSSHAPGGSPTRTSTRTTLPPSSWRLVGCKKKAFKPSCDAINAKYYQLFCGKGGKGLEEDCEEDKEEADEAPRPGGGSCRDSTRTQDLELRI